LPLMVEISPGELIDKITILEIKLERIADSAKRRNIEHEYQLLSKALTSAIQEDGKLSALKAELREVNAIIWEVEDDIRDHERRQDFGPEFVELARAVYHNNDRRAEIKRAINALLRSALVEEKSYTPY
jgi:hypothetical protein